VTAVIHETPGGEREPAEMIERNLRVAAHLWSSATAFFFLAFLFAYFYLRALNQNHLWHPHHVKPPMTTGVLIAVAVAASGVAAVLASRRLHAGDGNGWRTFGLGALVLGVVAIVLQIIEWWSLGFGPTDGGYASVFVGWTGLYLLFLIASLYWLETLLATSFRHRGHGAGTQVVPGADAFAFYWAVLSGIGVVTWFVLYIL
jgi:heme/copper-type cytochrome/quinol oxidase subunit 3